jgi:isoleucyl-tRNA synthetase
MFEPVTPNVDLQKVEKDQLEFWKTHDVFHRTMRQRASGPHYVFYEGPPTANGKPGTHHVLARAFKDMFPRYKTMNGFYVLRKGGWDTHGLPVEIEVEKQLGLEHKWQIDEYGIAAFNQKCKESVFKYIKDWEVLTERIAFWVDLDEAYVTFTNDYIQSVWWILRQYWDQGLLYQGHKVVPYCPRCGTPLSSHEVNQGYEDNTPDPSVYVRFRTQDDPNTFFLVWTTTPWTLPGNVALAVGDEVDYVKVCGQNEKGETETLIVAEALLYAQPPAPKKKASASDEPNEVEAVDEDRARTEVVNSLQSYEVVERLKGRDLLGMRYEPLYRFLPVEQDYAYVSGEFVSTSTGTGIVHMALARRGRHGGRSA